MLRKNYFILPTLFILLLAMFFAMIRLLKGPQAQDRVLALDCMYLIGMLAMLLEAAASGVSSSIATPSPLLP